jgi:hypothetical protein
MKTPNVIAAFAQHHSFDAAALLVEERDGIQCAVDCHNAVNDGYASLSSAVLEQDLAVGLIWQLYERCTERVYGALVAMATSCPASSEVVSRSAIEATVTIRYILRDRDKHLASFLQNHVNQAERQEKEWRKEAEQLEETAKAAHLEACDYRRQGIGAIKEYVDMINSRLVPSANVPAWPNISSRFRTVGDGIGYRTVYARLCTETHFDAEETLRYFIGTVNGTEDLERMGIETRAHLTNSITGLRALARREWVNTRRLLVRKPREASVLRGEEVSLPSMRLAASARSHPRPPSRT